MREFDPLCEELDASNSPVAALVLADYFDDHGDVRMATGLRKIASTGIAPEFLQASFPKYQSFVWNDQHLNDAGLIFLFHMLNDIYCPRHPLQEFEGYSTASAAWLNAADMLDRIVFRSVKDGHEAILREEGVQLLCGRDHWFPPSANWRGAFSCGRCPVLDPSIRNIYWKNSEIPDSFLLPRGHEYKPSSGPAEKAQDNILRIASLPIIPWDQSRWLF